MTLRKDVTATALTILAVLVYAAAHEGWGVPLVGTSHRWAAGAILLLGIGTCGQGRATKGVATLVLSALGVAALGLRRRRAVDRLAHAAVAARGRGRLPVGRVDRPPRRGPRRARARYRSSVMSPTSAIACTSRSDVLSRSDSLCEPASTTTVSRSASLLSTTVRSPPGPPSGGTAPSSKPG